ncbi:MAG: addiction module protein [Verrucomicrobia bacterium]|jgi:hypothetical protein|nr:addiction module protein [Verrucomicrobiota bacterium]
MSVADIKHAVAELPERERIQLAEWLLESFGDDAPEDNDAAGIKEAIRRREELDAGRATALQADEFWAQVDRARAQCE